MVTLATFDGETAEYRTVLGPLGLCDLAGSMVDPVDALASGDLPDWFGIAWDVGAQADDDGLATTSHGWVLWTEVDRVLRVARLPG